jgi:hypothetical protein
MEGKVEREAARSRSPRYPNFGLPEALVRVKKVFDADRRNPIDREVALKHIGYSGASGAADKALATLQQFGLLDRVGKGEVRVSQLAVDILHPDSDAQGRRAIAQAAFAPTIFKTLRERFPDGRFSDDALRSYLVRSGFLNRAVEPVVRAYGDTCRHLEQVGAYESDGADPPADQESAGGQEEPPEVEEPTPPLERQGKPARKQEVGLMADERVLTTGLLSKESSFRLIVNGRVGVKEIERLIKKLEFDKDILAEADDDEEAP